MLREHAQLWGTLESAERELAAGTGPGRARCRTAQHCTTT
jgi:hypothetical protein